MVNLQNYSILICGIHALYTLYFLGIEIEDEKNKEALQGVKNEKFLVFFVLLPIYLKAMGAFA